MGVVFVDPKTQSEDGVVTLHVGQGGGNGEGLDLSTWKSYSFNSHFLTPTDGWSFTLGDDSITDALRTAIAPRQKVTLSVDGVVLSSGLVDKIHTKSSRHGGTEITVEGRDLLGQAISSVIDPRQQFTSEMSLRDLLAIVFEPYGWGKDHILATDEALDLLDQSFQQSATAASPAPTPPNGPGSPLDYTTGQGVQAALQALAAQQAANPYNIAKGKVAYPSWATPADAAALQQIQATKNIPRKISKGKPIPARYRGHGLKGTTSIKTTGKKGKPLKDFQLHLLKPHSGEGAFAFAARVAQRFGLWIWPSADGSLLIVGTPDFNATPELRAIHRRADQGDNNILDSELVLDTGEQPSVIFCSGFGAGGASPRDQFTVAVVNPMIQTTGALDAIWAKYPKTRPIDLSYLGHGYSGNGKDTSVYNPTGYAVTDTNSRPLFLHDEESKTLEELTAFAKRELALRMHKAFVYHFEVEGHSFKTSDGRLIPWEVDAMVAVEDEVCNVQSNLWILSRTFTKSRSGGTKTKLEAILPNTLVF